MYPVLTSSSNLVTTLSRGKLREMQSCVIHEELNGEYYMTFTYPLTGALYNQLLSGGSIRAASPYVSSNRLKVNTTFDIKKRSEPLDGIVEFTAQHISRRLAGSVCYAQSAIPYSDPAHPVQHYYAIWQNSSPGTFDGCSCYAAWSTGTDDPTEVSGLFSQVNFEAPKSVLACFLGEENSLVSTLGGDVYFTDNAGGDGGNLILVFYRAHRGKDRGAVIRFGVNMLDIEHTKDTTNAFNAYVPFWDDGNGNITYVTGYAVQPTTPVSPVIAVPLDCSNAFDSQPTSAQLVTYARDLLDSQAPWTGEETLHVDFVNGVEIDPHGADIQLGDTVHVLWEAAGITADLRVVAYDYDVLAERYISMELGTQQTQYVAVTGGAGTSGGSSYPPKVVAGTFTKTDNSSTLGGTTGIWHDGHVAQLTIGAYRSGGSYPANTYTQLATISPAPKQGFETVVNSPNGVATMIQVTTAGDVNIYPYNSAATGWIRAETMFFI